MIYTTQQLSDLCSELLKEPARTFVAIDTEFNRENTYWPELCLIQLASSKGAVVIDPLAKGISLAPLEEVLRSPHITKVFHAARQDLEILWRLFQSLPQPIFDTQLGALFTGLGDSIGYDSLVEQVLGVKLDKDQQYSDWFARPLAKEQIDYALADVVYLQQLYPILVAKLQELGRLAWVQEETLHLTEPDLYQPDFQEIWRRIKTHHRMPKNLAIVQEMGAWREECAQALDVNRGRLLRDENLLKIANELPKDLRDLKKMAASQLLTLELLEELADVIEQAVHRPENTWPQLETHHKLTTPQRKKFEAIRTFVQQKAQELGIPSRMLAGRRDMESLARGEIKVSRLFTGWRTDLLNPLKEILDGAV